MRSRPNGRIALPTTIVLTALVAVLTACSSSGGPASTSGGSAPAGSGTASGTKSVKIGFVGQLAGYWPFWAAQQQGYFTANGLSLSMTYIATDSNLTSAALSGSVDVIGEVPLVLYLANKNGGDMRMFCGMQNSPLYSVIAGKGISSIADLKGKKIAVSNATSGGDAFVAQAVLASSGIKPGEYTLIDSGAQSSRVAAVKSGAVAATLVNAPFNSEAIADGLTDLGQSTSLVPHLQWTGLAASQKWLDANQGTAKQLCKALVQGEAFVLDPSNSVKAAADLQQGTGLSAAKAKGQYTGVNSGLTSTFSRDGSMDSLGFAAWATLINVSPSSFTSIEDTGFLPSS